MKRYIAQPGDWAMAESKDGAWMRFDDHAAEVARLTAALEAVPARVNAAVVDALRDERLDSYLNSTSRAEALQARVAELEAEHQRQYEAAQDWEKHCKDAERLRDSHYVAHLSAEQRANAAESELADLRGRVERAKAQLTLAFGAYVPSWPQGAVEALEALRGR